MMYTCFGITRAVFAATCAVGAFSALNWRRDYDKQRVMNPVDGLESRDVLNDARQELPTQLK